MLMTKEEIAADIEEWRSKGFCCFIEKNSNNVIMSYHEEMDLDPLDTYIYCSRGEVYRYRAQYDLALMEYGTGLEIDVE